MSFLAVFILLVPSMVYASHESEVNIEEDDSCIFTGYIEKSWVKFQERPWVTGFVVNCDPEFAWQYFSSNDEGYFEKDRVFVRILDINGDLVESGNHLKDNSARYDDIETSPYVMNYVVNRSGEYKNTSGKDTVTVYPNQYLFYMPQILSLDFEHRGIYQIELTYDEEVRTVWFAVLDPDKRYQDP